MMQARALQEQLRNLSRDGEERDAERRAMKLGLKYVNLVKTSIHVESLRIIPEVISHQLRVIPFDLKVKNLSLAVVDPSSAEVKGLIKDLQEKGHYVVEVFVVSEFSLHHAWSYYQYVHGPEQEISGKVEIKAKRLQELAKDLVDFKSVENKIKAFLSTDSPLGDLVEIVLAGALNLAVSDIHFEATEREILMRYRIDGLLHDVTKAIPFKVYPSIVSRIKILSNLKLNVRDEPQDGRFSIALDANQIEIRVSFLPSEYGEAIVMRVLDPRTIRVGLYELGFRPDDLKIAEEQLQEPNGMILNTGPTGSGKTTTLYAFLTKVQNPELKIITLEDPIEYHLPGIEQTQVDSEAGYDFANGLRSIMRQDPDVILVGEIRDKETAITAIQSALTGHLVFSTVHANSSVGAIPRLIDLGARPASIGPAVNLVIAQRLVRILCPKCKQSVKIDEKTKAQVEKFLRNLAERVDRSVYQKVNLYKPVGCTDCAGIGYKGRIAVFELLDVGADMEQLIDQKVGEASIKEFAAKHNLVTMQQDGILKSLQGVTSLDEVVRITGTLQW